MRYVDFSGGGNMRPRKEVIEAVLKNGVMDRVNSLLSAAHQLMCESNNIIEETDELLIDNGLRLGELKNSP